MQDKFLITFGTVFGGKPLPYGQVDQSRLPDEVRGLLKSYRHTLIVLCVSAVLPLFFMKKVTILLAVPLVALSYVLKLRYEKQLDPLLAPYFVKDEK